MGIHDDQRNPADHVETAFAAKCRARLELVDSLEDSTYADVVGHPAIFQVNVRPPRAVLKFAHLPISLDRPAGLFGPVLGMSDIPDRGRVLVAAVATMIVEGYR